jgi:hypothetical protein
MNPVEAQGSDPFFLNVPFNKRWECHKPTIERLYVDEGYELPALIQTMKDDYKFDAVQVLSIYTNPPNSFHGTG